MTVIPDASETAPSRRDPDRPRTPPKTIPWPWTILLLLLLPAIAAGVWLGGAFHRADDRPVPSSRRPTAGYVPRQVAPMSPPVTPAPAPAAAPTPNPGPAAAPASAAPTPAAPPPAGTR